MIGGMMENMEWTVVQCTGDRADLESGTQRKSVKRPKHMSRGEFIDNFRPDSKIGESAVQYLLREK